MSAESTTAEPSWGYNHRQVAVRIPSAHSANVRPEHRPAGADCNPYLVVAAVPAGVHHGRSHRVDPSAIVEESQIMEWDDRVGPHWEGALSCFGEAALLPGHLGGT